MVEQVTLDRQAPATQAADSLGRRVERTRQWRRVGASERGAVLALFALVHGTGEDGDVVTRFGKLDSDRLADTATRASDQRDWRLRFRHASSVAERVDLPR